MMAGEIAVGQNMLRSKVDTQSLAHSPKVLIEDRMGDIVGKDSGGS